MRAPGLTMTPRVLTWFLVDWLSDDFDAAGIEQGQVDKINH
jgi:hypothetical protein